MSLNPSDITIKTYQDNFDTYKSKTTNEVSGEFQERLDLFCSNVATNWKIFELGSAHGRDARYMKNKWFDVYCTDIIPQALNELQEEWFETSVCDFRDELDTKRINKFDWVLANAVLLHAPKEIFNDILNRLISLLKNGGVFAFTLKNWEWDEITDEKMWANRYFLYHSQEEIVKTLNQMNNINVISLTQTTDWKRIQAIVRKS